MCMKPNVLDSVVFKGGLPKSITGVWGETAKKSMDMNPLSKRKKGGRRTAPDVTRGKSFIWVSPAAGPSRSKFM